MDILTEKALELYQHTARFPVPTILTATMWLEQKYHKTPRSKIAMTIALHYLILTLRHNAGVELRDRAGILRWRRALASEGVGIKDVRIGYKSTR